MSSRLPNEIITDVVGFLDPREDRQTLTNLRLTSKLLNLISSSRFLNNFQFSLGDSLEDAASRSFSMCYSPWRKNIKGLILRPNILLPKKHIEKDIQIWESLSSDPGDIQFLTEEGKELHKQMPANFCSIVGSLNLLVSSIGSQISALEIKMENARYPHIVEDYFSRLVAHLLYEADKSLPNLEVLRILAEEPYFLGYLAGGPAIRPDNFSVNATDSAHPLSLLSFMSNERGYCVDKAEAVEHKTPTLQSLISPQFSNERLDFIDYVHRDTHIPSVFKKIKTLELAVTKTYPISDIDTNAALALPKLFKGMEKFYFEGSGNWFNIFDQAIDTRTLKVVSLYHLTCNMESLAQNFLSHASNSIETLKLIYVDATAFIYSLCAGAPDNTPISTFANFFNYCASNLTKLTTFRLVDAHYVKFPGHRLENPPRGTDFDYSQLPLAIRGSSYERPLYTRSEADITAFFALCDIITKRRAVKGLKVDPWLDFCKDFQEEISEVMSYEGENETAADNVNAPLDLGFDIIWL